MMTVPMDNYSASSSWELAELLYKKNLELESGLRKSAQSRVPSDPNTWFQIRENYEAIILEDHDFSQKREVELALWQLHYRKIEEFRAHINAAAKSAGSVASQGGRGPARPDRVKKIRSVFKSFLSESTGFYHDLILKISAKFGLPLGFFSEGPESQSVLSKDEKKSVEMKKGLMSCHRCLIYLGDLARYKASYGEGDTVNHDYAAASSYYIQAASLCPSTGNPHHQLAILASYSGDDLVSVYRYFRSLAADIPFSTARDNLIIAFEKNRQSFSQLPGKPTPGKTLATRPNGRGRGRGDARVLTKESKGEGSPPKERDLDISDVLKSFSIRFVRLNGILFTRTSLETFGEIFSSVINDLLDLLSSGNEDELNFGTGAADNGLVIVRLIAILIFTVHNVNKETEGQSYAEVLQRTVLLQNAFTASFEFAGHIVKRCIQLHNAESSFLLPAILVFIEWLACHPDIADGSDVDEKQSNARSFFWNQCVSLLNKLMLSGLVSVDGDEDETCFFDMSRYDEGETGNRLALWEDFELRGFLPLVPAQLILDFSRKHSFESDGNSKERKSRVQRIFAAGRALTNVVEVDHKAIYFDPCYKKFVIGTKTPVFDDYMHTGLPNEPKSCVTNQVSQVERNQVNQIESTVNQGISKLSIVNHGNEQLKVQLYVDGEDEEEEIVFKPIVGERYPNGNVSSTTYESVQPAQISRKDDWASFGTEVSGAVSKDDWASYGTAISGAVSSIQMPSVLHATSPLNATAPNISQLPVQQMQLNTSKGLMAQEAALSSDLKKFNINGNGMAISHGLRNDSSDLLSAAFQTLLSGQSGFDTINALAGQTRGSTPAIPSNLDSIMPLGMTSNGLPMKLSALPSTSRKNPVSRPVRHSGPPPGFSHVPSKQLDSSSMDSAGLNEQNQLIDDYSWLDGYHSSTTKGLGMENSNNHSGYSYARANTNNTNVFNGAMNFPFPGKQISTVHTPVANEKWHDFQLFENLKAYKDQQVQQTTFIPSLMPEQHQAQSMWSAR
ncbi:protein SMG7-like [Iris pallida]|uniref:Protein SMG7-like n=1 Tax=Iris pallida TaxID=29817 RepID=A0AAX6IJ12_IRIPA|nr:protein SMG7-like [Iris pallida]